MKASDVETEEFPPLTPVPPELAEQANGLMRQFRGCFWFWDPEAQVRHVEDARLVVKQLRDYGDWHAWRAAQELHRCLLPHSKKTS